jgi:hypothetical protein
VLPDWMALRDQWEYTHAVRVLLLQQIVTLGALVLSMLARVPSRVMR